MVQLVISFVEAGGTPLTWEDSIPETRDATHDCRTEKDATNNLGYDPWLPDSLKYVCQELGHGEDHHCPLCLSFTTPGKESTTDPLE